MPVPTDELLEELFHRPSEQGVSLALVATRHGAIVAERYGVQPSNEFQEAQTISASSTLLSWSMAKSITHAAVGVLVGDGVLDVDAPAAVPSWAGTDKEQITLNHLLEMRPGLAFVEDYVDGETSNCIEMLFSGTAPSFAQYAADLPLTSTPGTVFNYSSGTTNIVSRIVGDVVCRRAGLAVDAAPSERERAVTDFLHERVFAPAGMTSAIPKFDEVGDFVGSSYVYATARDFTRFGELYARDGVSVDGRRVLPTGWVDHASEWTAHDDSGLDYGRHWWLWPAFPGSYACHGYEGQYVVVVPQSQLVVTHLGKTDTAHAPGLRMRLARIIDSLL
ncbi:serine hydrolase domain-containing protein [Ilumatobacter coccineus]|uniref:Peptidase S12 family protein n=1 Tax=Ilumatobacter coccineus (strain NBRC 103263 / KCTC 29153 / YM16-304) TaxID=1313172 RepID=A0A6C7E494_ILUCY|nr:serine hydrolase domain-containing protein [Ilumatobacter coccineus]BAN01737.1 peptidase S12 family protein [Ilumatobacter coccineus YM16-304]